MKSFEFNMKENILFGERSVQKLPEILRTLCVSNVMIVTGPSLIKHGTTKELTTILTENDIIFSVFSDIEANPSIETANKAFLAFKESNAKAIIAFGGGSPMDIAKVISVLAVHGGKVTDYEGIGKIPKKDLITIIAIPTTAGTGSEVTASAVITDHQRHFKFSIISPEIIPSYAILDPIFLTSLPENVAASTGIDAIVHALEAYVSLKANPYTDALAEKALELLGSNIRTFVANRCNIEAASAMILGSNLAGLSFARAMLGNVHAMAHPLGGYFNIPHGVANAVLLPTVVEYNADYVDVKKYEVIYRAITGDNTSVFRKEMLTNAIRNLCCELNIPKKLSDLNVDPKLIPNMANDAMKAGNVKVNPRPTTLEDMIRLFNLAM